MQIDLDLLYAWGAVAKDYKKNDIVFREEDPSNFYYQIIEGCVRMYNSNDEGKEFTQGYFKTGDSFGEPPLFINKAYPSTAATTKPSKIIKLAKDKFLKILDDYPEIQRQFLNLMAERVLGKSKTIKFVVNDKPEFRITAFLETFKKDANGIKQLVPFTRQEIANFTGLRVETVIRTFAKMQIEKKIEIVNHKIYY